MAFTRKTEVRHISQAELMKIAEILNQPSTSPSWKKLMQIVPYKLTHPEQLSDGEPKYNFHNIKSIENAGAKLNNAAQIFLEEWITSGRIRPTLSHLLQLFIKSELFRAADYVAINLLSETPPQRPRKGPAAKVDISLPQDDDIDHELLNYPNLNNSCDSDSKNIGTKQIFNRTSMPDRPMSEEDLIRMAVPLRFSENVTATPQPSQTTNGFYHSPEICASRTEVPHNVSSSSQQLSNGTQPSPIESSPSFNTPHRSEDEMSSTNFGLASESLHNFVPNFAELSVRCNASNNSSSQPNGVDVPNLSILNAGGNDVSATEQRESNNGIVPSFSKLLPQQSNASTSAIASSSPSSTTYRSAVQISSNQFYQSAESSHNFVPNFSLLGVRSKASNNPNTQPNYVDIPNLPILHGTEQRDSFVENVPHLPQLLDPSQSTSVTLMTRENQTDRQESSADNVPRFSQIMN